MALAVVMMGTSQSGNREAEPGQSDQHHASPGAIRRLISQGLRTYAFPLVPIAKPSLDRSDKLRTML